MWRPTTALLCLGLAAVQVALAALEVDLNDQASIRKAAEQVAEDLFTYYPRHPGWFTGLLDIPPPDGLIHWWISGSFWATLLDYRHATGDTKYDSYISEALLFQVGDDKDYLPRNWTSSIGNDDQAFWAFNAMIAAEIKFPDPPADKPQWLALAQAVFNEQTLPDRRAPKDGNCNGGLRWQRVLSSAGFVYVNTISNACYFNLGARLGRYTGNQTYIDHAVADAENMFRLGYIDSDFNVYDGAHLPDCTDTNKVQYSYNAAIMLQTCAYMYNITDGAQIWKDRVDGLVTGMKNFFFPDGVAVERSCEPQGKCNIDQRVFKGFTHRWMGSAGVMAPFAQQRIQDILKTSTAAAVKVCTGGSNGRLCGFDWASGTFSGSPGAAEQMNMLGALTSLLMPLSDGPLTNSTGGTSAGNPDAGSSAPLIPVVTVTTGDRAGAGILTALFVAGALMVFGWMSYD